ncbi:GNAT family N-acetyltransferase [Leptothoe spongobia]|uniref:GNAT family N-acetyltransferase n=1 Tax=Leptothoe spongobia TAU-MAC 1115 TaxID=1967444 RepID=A0A947GK90_9CYAN|nr:GNAT family N-acetyltransferase [Leptothoe spongobia]MBT9317665.1 GNAT family N-acetyltransferase [Leptothoe spongobia TAU-MAC 1115]
MRFIPATEHHYPAIASLVTSPQELYLVYPNGHYPWDVEQLKTIATQRHELTVGIIDHKVVAFANFYDLTPQQSAHIGNVIVEKNYRGQGFGKALIQHMVHTCQNKYQAIPHISVFNANTRALILYAELGFEPYAVEPMLDLNNGKVALIHMKYAIE